MVGLELVSIRRKSTYRGQFADITKGEKVSEKQVLKTKARGVSRKENLHQEVSLYYSNNW